MPKASRQFQLNKDMTASPGTMNSTGADATYWKTYYGTAFRLATTPKGAATVNGKSVDSPEGTVSLITPYNGDAWKAWPEASDEAKTNFQSNWKNIWGSSGGYKQRQVLGAMRG